MLMTPKETRNMKLGEKLVRNLARRNMKAFYCPTTEAATAKVMELMPQGSSVTWGGSMSIRDMGLTETIAASGRYEVFDRDKAAGPDEAQEIYRKAFGCDFFISSANAISEDGEIVNIDGNGNRVAAITFGPKNVVFVIGINKVCRDCEAAVKRARSTAAPVNAARFDIETPCHTDGVCHNCNSKDCICNFIHILRNSPKGRHKVVIVGEELGY